MDVKSRRGIHGDEKSSGKDYEDKAHPNAEVLDEEKEDVKSRRGIHGDEKSSGKDYEDKAHPNAEVLDEEKEVKQCSKCSEYYHCDKINGQQKELSDDELLNFNISKSNIYPNLQNKPSTFICQNCELPQENKQPATTRCKTFVLLCGVVVVPILCAYIYPILNPKGEPEVDVKQFEQTPAEELFDAKLYRLEDVYRTQEPELWWTLAAGIKSTLKRPIHPSVFLMLYDSESAGITAKCLAKDVSKPTTKFLMNQVKEPIIINGVELREEALIKDSGLLVEQLNITVRDTGVLIVLDLHKVPAKVAESFHYICDRFSPLVDKAVLFFTLKVNAFSAPTLVKTAEERLKQLWSNNMEDYKMHPLITRMTPNVVKVMNDFSTC